MSGSAKDGAATVDVDVALVRELLREQHPDLAGRRLARVDAGWDNAVFRLGDDLVVRVPRREPAALLILHEQRWLPELAPRLPLPVPEPVRVGRPGATHPWAWSVVRWLPGSSALTTPPDDPIAAARTLGAFLRALHEPAPPDAPPNPYRGIPLGDRDDLTRGWIDEVADRIDAARARACWEAHVALPRWDGPPLWLHGDLHPHNVIVRDGRVSAVIDFGDVTAGDPATDLGIAWMLLPPEARAVLRDAAGVDEATWARGRGWALALGLAYVASPASSPDFERLGLRTIAAVLADRGT